MRTDVIRQALFDNITVDTNLKLRAPIYGEDLSSILNTDTYYYQPTTIPSSATFINDAINLKSQNRRMTYVVEYTNTPIGWFYFDMKAETNNITFNWGLNPDGRNQGWLNSILQYLIPQLLNLGAKYFIKYNLLSDTISLNVSASNGMVITAGINKYEYYPQIGSNQNALLYSKSYDNTIKSCGCGSGK